MREVEPCETNICIKYPVIKHLDVRCFFNTMKGGEKVKKYYSLVNENNEADIYIFGDIVDPVTQAIDNAFFEINSDVSGYSLVRDINALDANINVINVHINSYGGDVAESLAICNTLINHKAYIRTYDDGFACSGASIIFMAGDERIMNSGSLLMIHPAWLSMSGNAEDLRKAAEDLDIITQGSINVYMMRVNISEQKLIGLMAAESWILPTGALDMGFATGIINQIAVGKAVASARNAVFLIVKNSKEKVIELQKEPETIPEIIPEPEMEAEPIEPTPPIPSVLPKEPAEPKENKTLKFISALMR